MDLDRCILCEDSPNHVRFFQRAPAHTFPHLPTTTTTSTYYTHAHLGGVNVIFTTFFYSRRCIRTISLHALDGSRGYAVVRVLSTLPLPLGLCVRQHNAGTYERRASTYDCALRFAARRALHLLLPVSSTRTPRRYPRLPPCRCAILVPGFAVRRGLFTPTAPTYCTLRHTTALPAASSFRLARFCLRFSYTRPTTLHPPYHALPHLPVCWPGSPSFRTAALRAACWLRTCTAAPCACPAAASRYAFCARHAVLRSFHRMPCGTRATVFFLHRIAFRQHVV